MPPRLVNLYRTARLFLSRRGNRKRAVQEVFTRIYQRNQWGGKPGEFCSGSGSTAHHAAVYAEVIRNLISEKEISSVVDLGCGDFAVASQLLMAGVSYTGVDIVADLIRRNVDKFGADKVSFRCLDIISEEPPDGELCLVRQVFQHLSNDQIAKALGRLGKYRYVVVTEHYPAPTVEVVPNKDKPHGADIRVYDNSGVYLDLPPFSVTISRLMLEVQAGLDLVSPGEVLRTFLIENQGCALLVHHS